MRDCSPSVYRRKLKSEAKLESSLSYFSFKRWKHTRFQPGFDAVNLHGRTLVSCSTRSISATARGMRCRPAVQQGRTRFPCSPIPFDVQLQHL